MNNLKFKYNKALNKTLLLLGSMALPMTSFSQTEDLEDTVSEKVIETIVVTASRRETDIQETAISLEVFSGDELAKSGLTSITDFIDTVPGVTSVSNGGGNNRITIRNVATSTQEGGSAVIATYFDDFAVEPALDGSPALQLVDMQRVEVLKGPQGTLYGKSAMGGIVRYISNKPDTSDFYGGFNGFLSSTTDGGINSGGDAFVNIPLSEKLAMRFVGYDYQYSGFIDNVELNEDDFNTDSKLGGRLAFRWNLTDSFTADLTYLNQSINATFGSITTTRDPGSLSVVGDEGPDIPFDVEARTAIGGILQETKNRQKLMNLKLEKDFDNFTTTFLATRTVSEFSMVFDQREFIGVRAGCVCDFIVPYNTPDKLDSNIYEFRMVSSGGSSFDWIAGAYLQDSNQTGSQFIRYLGPDQLALGFLPLTEELLLIDGAIDSFNKEKAIYGEIGYHFNDTTNLTLGYRSSKIDFGSVNTKANGIFDQVTGANLLVGIPFGSKENVSTYKAAFQHSFSDDVFAYASATSGYRVGGFNVPTAISSFSTFDSDTLWNYEMGIKSTLLGGKLVANASVYYIDYSDIQLVVQDPVTFNRATQNAGKAGISGVEFSLAYLINDNFDVSFSGSLSNPELKEDVPGGVSGKKGDRLPGSAKENFTIRANWNQSLSDSWNIFAATTLTYVGDRLNDFNTDLDVTLPSYQLLNLRLGFENNNGFSVSLFANNVFDETIIYLIDRQGPAFESVPTNRPRTVGLRASFQF